MACHRLKPPLASKEKKNKYKKTERQKPNTRKIVGGTEIEREKESNVRLTVQRFLNDKYIVVV